MGIRLKRDPHSVSAPASAQCLVELNQIDERLAFGLCQLILIRQQRALRIQYILKRCQSLFIEVEREVERLLALIDYFAEGDDLFDGVFIGTHRIIDFLYGGEDGLVELPDCFV